MKVDWSKEPKTYLARFSSPLDEIKIIIAIGKLNESVDVPTVENVVFWRQTDVERIFLQQF
jgi:superfamily II DNA or RNA helicase